MRERLGEPPMVGRQVEARQVREEQGGRPAVGWRGQQAPLGWGAEQDHLGLQQGQEASPIRVESGHQEVIRRSFTALERSQGLEACSVGPGLGTP